MQKKSIYFILHFLNYNNLVHICNHHLKGFSFFLNESRILPCVLFSLFE